MLSPRPSGTTWGLEKRRDADEYDDDVPRLHNPQPYLYRPQSNLRGFLLTGLFLLLFVVLHRIDPQPFVLHNATCSSQTPSLHFSTPGGAHTAPFGLFIDDDKMWHIYFQFYPTHRLATHCASWGHATSPDLYTWSIHRIALQNDGFSVCGGSVVMDRNNTSRLFPNQTNGVVALYMERRSATTIQQLAVAHSFDGGYKFTKTSKRPRLSVSDDLRDPKVTWHEPTQRWIMTATKRMGTAVGIYTSPNLLEWNAVSEFTAQDLGIPVQQFEYPSLVSIPRINSTGGENLNHPTVPGGTLKYMNDYIFIVSSKRDSPLNGGSHTRYFPGTFNGTYFQAMDTSANRFIDFGPDNYASQFFFGLADEKPIISLGLSTNPHHGTTSLLPSSSQPSILTLPRESHLIYGPNEGDLSFFSRPFNLDSLRDAPLATLTADNISDFHITYGGSDTTAALLEVNLEMQPPDDETVEFNVDFMVRFSKGAGPLLCTAVFHTWDADFGCDRSLVRAGRPREDYDDEMRGNRMAARGVRPLLPFHNPAVRRWLLQIVLDGPLVEVFLNGGVRAGTMNTFAGAGIAEVEFQSSKIPAWAGLSAGVQSLRA